MILPVDTTQLIGVIARAGHPVKDTPGRPAIGAVAPVTLPDGRKLVAQVDGGSGHSGRRAPEIHLGLGDVPKGTPLATELKWRDADGKARATTLTLQPGWHTIRLGRNASDVARIP